MNGERLPRTEPVECARLTQENAPEEAVTEKTLDRTKKLGEMTDAELRVASAMIGRSIYVEGLQSQIKLRPGY